MGGKCVLRAWEKLYKNTSGARHCSKFWFSYSCDTTESQNGWGWRGPLGCPCPSPCSGRATRAVSPVPLERSRCALLQPRVEPCPLPPALRILNSPPWPLQPCISFWAQHSPSLGSLGGGIHHQSTLGASWIAPVLLSYPSSRDQGGSSGPLKSANCNLRLLLSVEGLILLFSH